MIPIRYNIRSLMVRRATTFAAVLGIALVVFVLSASLMLSAGVERTLGVTGRDDHAIVIRKGSDGELASSIEVSNLALIGAAPGVKRGANGEPLLVGEVMVVATLNRKGETNSISNVAIRGVPEHVWSFRPEVKLISGRAPRPGTDEAAVGRAILGRYEGLELGQRVELKKNREVTLVGVFESGGSSFDSELWTDVDTLSQAFGRPGTVSSVRVQLESPAAFDAFDAAVESDKRLGLESLRETTFYEKQSKGTAGVMSVMGSVVSFFLGFGAIIGAMITMYAAVAHRQREVGTLRALGFKRRTILASFLLESTLVALAGGALGALCALALSTVKFALLNQTNWSEMVFTFAATPGTLGAALAVSALMGLLGGLLPAVRAARLSPVKAMRE